MLPELQFSFEAVINFYDAQTTIKNRIKIQFPWQMNYGRSCFYG